MYSVYFTEKEGRRKGKSPIEVDRVIEFEPHGVDVRLTFYLLAAQAIGLAVIVLRTYKEF